MLPFVSRRARSLARRLNGAEYDDLVGAGCEALVRAIRRGVPDDRLGVEVHWRMLDAWKAGQVGSLVGRRWWARPLVESIEARPWSPPSTQSAEDDAMPGLLLREAWAVLTPDQRQAVAASMTPGGQKALYQRLGITERAMCFRRQRIRRQLAHLAA